MNPKPLKEYCPVVPFQKGVDRIGRLDLSSGNQSLTEEIYNDLNRFCAYIEALLTRSGARYLVGGYGELRKIYAFSEHFGGGNSDNASQPGGTEPRRLHLGQDVWSPAGTPVFAPVGGILHSAAWNGTKGDYGGTVILQHRTGDLTWHTLYGHLSKASVSGRREGEVFAPGSAIGELGVPAENGQWPPHLHFQVILDMQGNKGDYPGVCRYSERAAYLENCPDPEGLLPWGEL